MSNLRTLLWFILWICILPFRAVVGLLNEVLTDIHNWIDKRI